MFEDMDPLVRVDPTDAVFVDAYRKLRQNKTQKVVKIYINFDKRYKCWDFIKRSFWYTNGFGVIQQNMLFIALSEFFNLKKYFKAC